ncbi:Bax inhibitor-1/YccA family protein [Euryarchaeota archaeon]|nr:Bax inhibitor-1/YccA family protein [Euryarchaeota archaeon]
MYRSRNPALSDSTFDKSAYSEAPWWDDQDSNMMTMEGTAEKTGILLILIATTAIATAMFMPASAPLVFLGAITGFILALVIIFTGSTNPVLISTYAILQGLVLGGITWIYEIYFPGIGILAVVLTLAILGAMLVIYRAGLISWSKNLQIAVYSSLSAIVLIYLVDIIGLFLGFRVPVIHEASPLGILFSLFVVGIASLCLVADFDFIERGVERGAPKQLEWRAAFGLMVTLIWLYLEILELLAKLAAVSKR